MTILKRIVAVVGEYQANDGTMKKRYRTIGHLHEGKYGQYLTLDALTNLAAIPRREGDDRVTANLYDPEERDQRRAEPSQPAAEKPKADFDDDLPF